jgi:hypothetical protein
MRVRVHLLISATAPHKLSPRSTRCLFLGYSPNHKGYRCLDLTSHRIISRYVVFDEDVFPLVGSSPPTDLDSLLESDPSTHPSQAPRLAPLPAPHAASPHSHAAPSTPSMPHVVSMAPLARLHAPHAAPSTLPAPCAAPSTPPAPRAAPPTTPVPRAAPATLAPSTSGNRFADPSLVYRRRGSAPLSAPTNPGPSTSAARFADPTVVYYRRRLATPVAPEPLVYHPVAIHRDPGHIHPMVTHHAAGVLRPVDRLILAADTTTTPPDASPVPSSVRTTSLTQTGVRPWRSMWPYWPTTPGTWCRVHPAPMWSPASGCFTTS